MHELVRWEEFAPLRKAATVINMRRILIMGAVGTVVTRLTIV
jgi:hypothetical protein